MDPEDFIVVDVPSMLAQVVTFGLDGSRDTDWNREAAETQYIFAEFLSAKGLLIDGVNVARHPELVVRWSELTEAGQKFARSEFHKWLGTVDQSGTTPEVMAAKLEKRWIKYLAKHQKT